MKYLIVPEVLVFLVFVSSCKKDNNASIVGKWNIITDSSYVGAGTGNHLVVYKGQQGDYFNFSTDGKLYIKEGGMLDTLYYHSSSNATMNVAYFPDSSGTTQAYTISNLSAHNVTVSRGFFITPGGIIGKHVDLDR